MAGVNSLSAPREIGRKSLPSAFTRMIVADVLADRGVLAGSIIVAVSIKVSELRESIDSIEVNPVLVRSDGAFALDARCILSAP